MNKKLPVLNKIFSYHFWRHRVDLGDGLRTMGYNTLDRDWEFYGMPEDLKGMTVLDIGANDGYYSFGAEQRGASKVTAIDIYGGDGKSMVGGWPADGINMLREYLNSNIEIISLSLYDLPKLNRKWDVVFCNDVLSWLNDVDSAIAILCASTQKTLVIRDTFSTESKANVSPITKSHDFGSLNRMGVGYLKRKLRENGFRKISVKRIYSYKHYEWQFENFPSAESSGVIEVYKSPLDVNPSGNAIINGQWILMSYGDFYYIRTLGWVRKTDVRIKTTLRKKGWVKHIKKIIPIRVTDWYHNLGSIEKKVQEYRVIATR